MHDFTGIESARGWYKEKGPENDVVISSRARFSRNLTNYAFPIRLKEEDAVAVCSAVTDAFSKIPESQDFQAVSMGTLEPIKRRILLERKMISQSFSLQAHKTAILSKGDHFSCLVNQKDHLRLQYYHGGLNLEDCLHKIDSLDDQLEHYLNYAVSLEWGYLNSELPLLGTGFQGSLLFHLPALEYTSVMEKALKAVVQLGFSIQGYFGVDESSSLGGIYEISNQFCLGLSEYEILEKLDNVGYQLVNYERRAREEMMVKRRIQFEDRFYRAYGILRYCRAISSKEAIELLSQLRLAIALEVFDLPIEIVTALMFLTQKSHMQQLIEGEEESTDADYIAYTRADFIRKVLWGN